MRSSKLSANDHYLLKNYNVQGSLSGLSDLAILPALLMEDFGNMLPQDIIQFLTVNRVLSQLMHSVHFFDYIKQHLRTLTVLEGLGMYIINSADPAHLRHLSLQLSSVMLHNQLPANWLDSLPSDFQPLGVQLELCRLTLQPESDKDRCIVSCEHLLLRAILASSDASQIPLSFPFHPISLKKNENEPLYLHKLPPVRPQFNFSALREQQLHYVDKTEQMLSFLQNPESPSYICGPEGSGKSIFLRTVEAYYKKQVAYFHGTCLEESILTVQERPTLFFAFRQRYLDRDCLFSLIRATIDQFISTYNLTVTNTDTILRLYEAIDEARKVTGSRVVVLLDGYDDLLPENREVIEQILPDLLLFSDTFHLVLIAGRTPLSDYPECRLPIQECTLAPQLTCFSNQDILRSFRQHLSFLLQRYETSKEKAQCGIHLWAHFRPVYSRSGLWYTPESVLSSLQFFLTPDKSGNPQTFGQANLTLLRCSGFPYVDKTPTIYRLLNQPYSRPMLFTRPRRFGKSLLVSTIQHYFSGDIYAFAGLQMLELEMESARAAHRAPFQKHPIIHIELPSDRKITKDTLEAQLSAILTSREKEAGIPPPRSKISLAARLSTLISTLSFRTRLPVVVLVDEYDVAFNDPQAAELFTETFSVLKSMENLRFVLFTGVLNLKLTLSNISGLNNVRNLSFESEYNELCGFTEQEFLHTYYNLIRQFATKYPHDPDPLTFLRKRFDGYRFATPTRLYNPWSVLSALTQGELSAWTASAPTPEADMLQETLDLFFDKASRGVVPSTMEDLKAILTSDTDPAVILFHSGYLTITDNQPEVKDLEKPVTPVLLGFPNDEVRELFVTKFRKKYVPPVKENDMPRILEYFNAADVEHLILYMSTVIASIATSPDASWTEYVFRFILQSHFTNVPGLEVKAEDPNNKGRADLVFITNQVIFCIELKKDQSAQTAVAQIKEQTYLSKYLAFYGQKSLYILGINCRSDKRNIHDWNAQQYIQVIDEHGLRQQWAPYREGINEIHNQASTPSDN